MEPPFPHAEPQRPPRPRVALPLSGPYHIAMALPPDIEAVIFDIGGTLLDFAQPESLVQLRAGLHSIHAHLTSTGLHLPPYTVYRRRLERRALRAYLFSRLRGAELDPMRLLHEGHARMGIALEAAAVADLGKRLYAPTKAIARAHPETAGALSALRRRGYRLAIISNTIAPPVGLEDHLADEGLLEYFPVRIFSCVLGVPKPHPRIFRAALDALAMPAERAVYVGDKPKIDVRGARRVGMGAVLRHAPGLPPPPGPAADAVIRQIVDLLGLLPDRGGS